jgi:outer membrane lipoprotein-sorting protein
MRDMRRRAVLESGVLALLAAGRARAQAPFQPTAQDRADLARIEASLNDIRTLKARFLQVAPDGRVTEGTAWLERPGRMRFEYNPPAPFLLIANHGVLVFQDKSLAQTSNIPLSRTPLGILLAEQVKLSGDISVTGMQRQPGQIQVTLTRTSSPGEGTLTLIFADPPLALKQWVVVDAQRQATKVTLYDAQRGGQFDQSLFDVLASPYERNRGG